METNSVVKISDVSKKFRGFELSVPKLQIPKGYATALVGENGAGKTTLLNLMAGIRLDYKGEIRYFDEERKLDETVQEYLGYVGPGSYFLPHWTVKQVEELSGMLFDHFHSDRFWKLCEEMNIPTGMMKEVKTLSDGNKVKLMLAAVLARDTKLLLMDEPASPLDPLMRDKLCELIRDYLEQGNGEKSVLFSTHNVSDMENVTDYLLIMEHGMIVEQGFVEDLKEKYISVKGESADAEKAKDVLLSMSKSSFGFDGICLAEKLDQLAGLDIALETPTLSQICVAVLKANTKLTFAK